MCSVVDCRFDMGLSQKRATEALNDCTELSDFRRGTLRSFLSWLTYDQLVAMQIDDSASHDEIVGFLDYEEKHGGDSIWAYLLL